MTEFLPKYKRSLLAQLRTGILPLSIETVRYYCIALENRICLLCNLNKIEDEIDIICECKAYSHIINSFHIEYRKNLDTFDQFISILTFHESKVTANFLEAIWNFRKSKLFTN